MIDTYKNIAECSESTVVSKYEPTKSLQQYYQSEADLEKEFIKQLQLQQYEYLPIKKEEDLKLNLRKQLEKLNNFTFSDDEWDNFFKQEIANNKNGIIEKTKIIQQDHVKNLKKDDGDTKNIYLLDKKNIHNNILQVINQYEVDNGERQNRYDCTILVNGLPLVHIELKRRGVSLENAFNQINRYQRDSFWVGSGLFEYIQIFVISNGTYTKYYSNTTKDNVKKEINNSCNKNKIKTSNSFCFTSWWADETNKPITDLIDFTKTFFAKHTILNIITKYCVFTTENILQVMRPYQIVATEKILNKIKMAYNLKLYGSIKAGGYIWHTTGSGKTLTSFKTAQLVRDEFGDFIDKVLFVVDRKDLDAQTMKEFNKFEKDSVDGTSSTNKLEEQLNNSNNKIIVTTIQKLSILTERNNNLDVYNKHVVLIFDECHRSQCGDMHDCIIKKFKKYYLFGFTGTPIFIANPEKENGSRTTEQSFGDQLHTYTIVNAINDKNVLPFRIDYVKTCELKKNIIDEKVKNINTERILMADERIKQIVKYIIENFDRKTSRNEKTYKINDNRLNGFNSIFATQSIKFAKLYYSEFKKQNENLPNNKKLKFAIIYSFDPNGSSENYDGTVDNFDKDENLEDIEKLDKSSRDFLDDAIADYNKMFNCNFNTSSKGFQNYYKDVSEKMKKRQLDLLIVVDMFLTGFDATTLNTLWVDKNLRLHGLLQAFSRTNRILNNIKVCGNIVSFRDLEEETKESMKMFGDKDAESIAILKNFNDYYNGYIDNNGKFVEGYKTLVLRLKEEYNNNEIIGEENKKDFIRLYNNILKLKNVLSLFDDFDDDKQILTEREFQDYQSMYINIYEGRKREEKNNGDSVIVNDDIEFEIDLIKHVDINVDYILNVIKEKYEQLIQDADNNEIIKDETIKDKIINNVSHSINASVLLRDKKELIEQFINSLNPNSDIEKDWNNFSKQKEKEELDKIIKDEKLNPEKTKDFIKNSFLNGFVQENGTDIDDIMPKVSRFNNNGEQRRDLKQRVINKIIVFFNKFSFLHLY